jgi:hypothetical protein
MTAPPRAAYVRNRRPQTAPTSPPAPKGSRRAGFRFVGRIMIAFAAVLALIATLSYLHY